MRKLIFTILFFFISFQTAYAVLDTPTLVLNQWNKIPTFQTGDDLHGFTISWNAVTGANQYLVRYKKEGDVSFKNKSSAATSLTITNLKTGRYQIGVQARILTSRGITETSGWANKTQVTKPSKPSFGFPITATATSATSCNISADFNASREFALNGYNIRVFNGGTRIINTTIAYADISQTLNITGLTPATWNRFEIRGKNGSGDSWHRDFSLFTPTVSGKPTDVRNFQGTVSSHTAISLRWGPPLYGGSGLTYNIDIRPNSGSDTIDDYTDYGSTNLSVTGLDADTLYDFRVQPVNGIGAGLWTNIISPGLTHS